MLYYYLFSIFPLTKFFFILHQPFTFGHDRPLPTSKNGVHLASRNVRSLGWKEDTKRTLVVHFHLKSLPDNGSLARVAFEQLKGTALHFCELKLGVQGCLGDFPLGSRHGVAYVDVELDLRSDEEFGHFCLHEKAMLALIGVLRR